MKYAVQVLALILGITVLPAAIAMAQGAGAPQATAVISGMVIDAVTRQPVKGAQVRARNLSPSQSGAPRAGSATTDAEGRFSIDGLNEGRYILFASLEGYVGQRFAGAGLASRLITVGAGQHTSDLLVELTPGATISGHVKSADSKPLAGVAVELLRYFQSDAGKQLRGVNAPVFTDAAGEYHIHGVPAGNYYLRAVPPTHSGLTKVAPKTALAPTYFGNMTDVANAATVPVRPGGFFAGMDFTLAPLHAVSVKGKVLVVGKVLPSSQVQVTLISNDSATSQHEAKADAKGDFEFQGITAGDYTLVARIEPTNAKSKMLWGQRPLHVGNANLRGADLRISGGVQLNGRIRADEKASAEFTHMTADLIPQGDSAVAALMPSVDNASVRSDGTFTFNDVPEGVHLLDINPLPQGYFLKSSTSPDVLESGVTISNAQSPPTLELTLSPDAAQLNGSVLNDQMPASGASVVLIPQGARTNQLRFGKRSVTDQSGRFSMRSIVPGDYKILAFQAVERSFLSDPEFLARFEDRAESIHIREGDTLNLSLDAIPAEESIP